MGEELISRERLLRTLKHHGATMLVGGNKVMERLPGYNPTSALNGYELCLKDVSELLANAPAVDAVEVVRCGLCKHWDEETLYCRHPAGLSYCGKTGAQKGFCCFGDRREDDV